MNVWESLGKIFYRPSVVFTELRVKRSWVVVAFILVTLVITRGLSMSLTMTRGIAGDPPVRIDNIRVYPREKTEHKSMENQEVVLSTRPSSELPGDPAGEVNEDSGIYVGAKSLLIGLSVILPVVYLFIALVFDTVYFRIVGAVMNLKYGINDWISFSIWSRVPAVSLATIATFVAVLALGQQSDTNHYQILSFAWWLSIPIEESRAMKEWIYQLDAAFLWIIVLQVIGFRRWSGTEIFPSIVIVVAPTAIVYGSVVFFLLSAMS